MNSFAAIASLLAASAFAGSVHAADSQRVAEKTQSAPAKASTSQSQHK